MPAGARGRRSTLIEWMEITLSKEDRTPRIPPVRGLVLSRTSGGRAVSLTDIKKWLRLNRDVFKARKIDVRAMSGDLGVFQELLSAAPAMEVRLSLRTIPETPPDHLDAWRAEGLHDVLVCVPPFPQGDALSTALARWIDACAVQDVPLRVQMQVPFGPAFDVELLTGRLAPVKVIALALSDPIEPEPPRGKRAKSEETLARINVLAGALAARGVETHVLHLPFCLASEDVRPLVANYPQFFLDHQHYEAHAYHLARRLALLSPRMVSKALEIELGRQTSFHNAIDNMVLPWILQSHRRYIPLWAFHKLTRHINFLRQRPDPLPETVDAAAAAIAAQQAVSLWRMGPVCAECRYRRICDHETEDFRRALPGVPVQALVCAGEDEVEVDPMALQEGRTRYYDPIDAERLLLDERIENLAREGQRITVEIPPTREIAAGDYEIQDHMTHPMPGAIRWFSFTNAELESTPLGRFRPPLTLSLSFGGGIAAAIGFSFGRHTRIVCPMIAHSHRLVLHIGEDGHYVLLRDGMIVHPLEFQGAHLVPEKLGSLLEPRIAITNIDGQIVTQSVSVWEGRRQETADLSRIKYSVLITCTRYSRRLQAVLLALAHQADFDVERLEIAIGYVPGIDATDDLVDSFTHAHPRLRIVRSPFALHHARSKGFMINETIRMTSGRWIVLLDADIALPPDFFKRLEVLSRESVFVAPEGRKMLGPEATARILLGEMRTWEDYDALLHTEGEVRRSEALGTPIGFCQCVRRDIFEEEPYPEFDHFEGADWFFGKSIVDRHGPEIRFEGMDVLHLDHGGSQWYGTQKHM